MQQCSEDLAENAPPSFHCDDIFVLLIVLYCITTATVSHLICPITDMASHMTHCAAQLLSQATCLYSLLISHSTLPLISTHFYLQMTMSCGAQQNCHDSHAWHSVLYLITVLTIWKASRSFPLSSKLKASFWKSWQALSSPTHLPCTLYSTCCTLHFTSRNTVHSALFLHLACVVFVSPLLSWPLLSVIELL